MNKDFFSRPQNAFAHMTKATSVQDVLVTCCDLAELICIQGSLGVLLCGHIFRPVSIETSCARNLSNILLCSLAAHLAAGPASDTGETA